MISEPIFNGSQVSDNISQIYWKGLAEETHEYKQWFKRDPESFITFLKKFEIPKVILEKIYRAEIRGGAAPIESLSKEEKQELWNLSGKDISLVRAIYIIKN